MITEIKLCKSFGNGFRVKNARAIKEDEMNKLSYSLSHYILRAKDNDFETVKELTYLQVIQLATPEIEILICDDEEFELIKEIKSEVLQTEKKTQEKKPAIKKSPKQNQNKK